jgi:hypothetical protein
MSRKANKAGRNVSGRFTRVDHSLMRSSAYRSLSPNARSLLLELAMIENGSNNGTLCLSVRDAADRMGVGDTTAATNAFNELESMGFIACAQTSHFAVKAGEGSRARRWRLTWLSTPSESMAPTHEYQMRRPDPNSRADKRMVTGNKAMKRHERGVPSDGKSSPPNPPLSPAQNKMPVADSATHNPDRVAESHTMIDKEGAKSSFSVVDFATRFRGNGGNPPKSFVRDSATYTADQLEHGSGKPPGTAKSMGKGTGGDRSAACEHCGAPFEDHTNGRGWSPKRFCSERCRKAAEHRRARTRDLLAGSARALSVSASLGRADQ